MRKQPSSNQAKTQFPNLGWKPLLLFFCLPALFPFASFATETEEKVTLDQVPQVVRQSLEKETSGAVIGEIEKETEDGVVTYEAEFTKNGKEYEIEIAADGKVLEVEEADDDDDQDGDDDNEQEERISLDQVPSVVRKSLEKETAGAVIGEIEKETEDGVVTYEAEFTKDGKEYEIEIAADGKVLEVEEADDDEDGDDDNEQEEKISLDQVPSVARKSLEKETAGAVIGEIEKETEDGVVTYEAEFTKDGKEYEIEIAADGKVLEVEEADDDDDDNEADDEDDDEDLFTFEETSAGSLPEGCLLKETHGQGHLAKWQVLEMDGAPSGNHVLALSETQNTGKTFNLLLGENGVGKDVEVSLKLKPISGQEDQGGGPVWRAQDENNYYVARWNPLERNVCLYVVKNGERTQLASADVEADPAAWHELEIEMEGDRIECEFDDKPLFEIQDNTLQGLGMLGLWTKADAATAFDDIEVEIED